MCPPKTLPPQTALPVAPVITPKTVMGPKLSSLAHIAAVVPAGVNPLNTWDVSGCFNDHRRDFCVSKTPLDIVQQGSQLSTRLNFAGSFFTRQ
jgi:hypothetical protein